MWKTSDRQRERLNEIVQREKNYSQRVLMLWKDVIRERAEQTAKLTSFRAYRGDLHIHSVYSDGTGTVGEIKAYADQAGLDFIFITDHRTVNQKRSCKKFKNVCKNRD